MYSCSGFSLSTIGIVASREADSRARRLGPPPVSPGSPSGPPESWLGFFVTVSAAAVARVLENLLVRKSSSDEDLPRLQGHATVAGAEGDASMAHRADIGRIGRGDDDAVRGWCGRCTQGWRVCWMARARGERSQRGARSIECEERSQ